MTRETETGEIELWRARLRVLAIWFFVGLVLYLLKTPLCWWTGLLGFLLLVMPHLAWGIVSVGYTLFLAYADHRRNLLLVGLSGAAALAFLLVAPLGHWGDRLIFSLAYEARFDAVVQSVQAGGPLRGWVSGFDYQSSANRQVVFFRWINGFLGSGTAVIYDPSGRLNQQQADLSDPFGDGVRDLFYDDLRRCWALPGPYSKCNHD